MSCPPSYADQYTPDFTPRGQPSIGVDAATDCALLAFDERRSRLFAGNAFFRSIEQDERMNGISIEATDANELNWLIWSNGSDPYNDDYIKTILRYHDVNHSDHYTCQTPRRMQLVSDPTGPAIPPFFTFVVTGNRTTVFNDVFAFYVLQSNNNTGIYVLDTVSFDSINNVTRITTKNEIPTDDDDGFIGNTYTPVPYQVTNIETHLGRTKFVVPGNVTNIFTNGLGFYARQFSHGDSNGEYIVETSTYDGPMNQTFIAIKDYRDLPRNVNTTPMQTYGELLNLHILEFYQVLIGTSGVGSPATCIPQTLIQLRTAVNAGSSLIEMLPRGTDVNDPEMSGYDGQVCYEPFGIMYLTGGRSRPDNSCVLFYVRTGPQRSMAMLRTSEASDGAIITTSSALSQWDGAQWISYSNLIPGSCPADG